MSDSKYKYDNLKKVVYRSVLLLSLITIILNIINYFRINTELLDANMIISIVLFGFSAYNLRKDRDKKMKNKEG